MKNHSISQKSVRKRIPINRWSGLFLVCLLLIFGCVYCGNLAHFVIYPLGTNDTRYVDANIVSPDLLAQKLELPGVPNLYKVSDSLYRGAQPTTEGMRQLENMGIKTIVNLRDVHSDSGEIKNTKLAYENIQTTAFDIETDDVVRFLGIVTDPNRTPVFVHCQRGADRTGLMCAVYRIVVQGWSKDQAIEEMTKGGFGFYRGWQNLIDYIRNLDVDQIKKQTGLK
jgi:tyrosine-protein phosphatase SIW14